MFELWLSGLLWEFPWLFLRTVAVRIDAISKWSLTNFQCVLSALVSISFLGTKKGLISAKTHFILPLLRVPEGRVVEVEAFHLMFVGQGVLRNQVKGKDTQPWARAWALWLPPAPTVHSSSLLISNSVRLLSQLFRWPSSSFLPPSPHAHYLVTLLRNCLTSYLVAPSSDWCPTLLSSHFSWSMLKTSDVCRLSVFIQTL